MAGDQWLVAGEQWPENSGWGVTPGHWHRPPVLTNSGGGKKLPQYEGENNKSKRGNAQEEFLCDQCAGKIPQGSPCYARSIWMDGQGIPYYEWEKEYIVVTS